MAGPASAATSPSSGSVASLGRITDEREFDRHSSTIPDSQPNNDFAYTRRTSKLFSADREEVSESTLAVGFSFPAKAPPRPGQFSQRPGHQAPKLANLPSQPQKDTFPSVVNRSSPHNEAATLGTRQIGVPLNHPAVSLPAIPPVNEVFAKQHTARPTDSIRRLPFSFESSPEIASPRDSSNAVSKSPASANSELKRPSRPQPPELEALLETSSSSRSSRAVSNTPQLRGLSAVPLQESGSRASHLANLKLPLPGATQARPAQNRNSPASICGDLERPAPQTPMKHRRSPRDRVSARSRGLIFSPGQNGRAGDRHDRSQSRTSNMSIKRSAITKHRARTDPERKQTAMHQVAQYWNECMQIAADERDEANWEIEQLQNEINRQGKELKHTIELLSGKSTELQQIDARCKELEDKENQVKAKNQQLNDELTVLRDEISESKKRASTFGEKSRTYKAKLNEAIAEQQALFVRSRTLYQECQAELEKEKSSRVEYTLEVDKALEDSLRKREQLKQIYQELRDVAEQESKTKSEVIAKLEAKVEAREAEINREKNAVNDLRHRIDEQTKVQESLGRLETQVQNLVTVGLEKEEQEQEKNKSATELSSKLDFIMEHLQTLSDNVSPPIDLGPITQDLEESILAKVLPMLLTIMSAQTKTTESISQLRNDASREIAGIKDNLQYQSQELLRSRDDQSNSHRELLDVFSELGTQAVETRKVYNETHAQMAEMTEMIQTNNKERTESEAQLQTEIIQQFRNRQSEIQEREGKLDALQQDLQLLTDDYASKVTKIGETVLQSDKESKEQLQIAISAIHAALEKGFREERATVEQSLAQSELRRTELSTQLEEVKNQLEVANNTLKNADTSKFRQSLNDERNTAVALREELARYEAAAKESEQLHERWRRDIQAIDTLREQLERVSEQVPQVEKLDEQFQRIMQMNQTMQTTASYLDEEGQWVQQQLESKAVSGMITASAPPVVLKSSQVEIGDLPLADIPVNNQRGIVNARCLARREDLLQGSETHASQPDPQRRVLVYSPAVDLRSPSPPVSVQEEQQRRREGITRRSILKSSQSSSQETSKNDDLPPKIPPNHSQYNRPVMSQPNMTSLGTRNEMIEQIRSSLIQPRPTQKAWDLITVMDFQKTVRHADIQPNSGDKRRSVIDEAQTEESSAKRVKTEEPTSETCVMGTLLKETQPLGLRRNPKRAIHRPILKTYSRRSSTQLSTQTLKGDTQLSTQTLIGDSQSG